MTNPIVERVARAVAKTVYHGTADNERDVDALVDTLWSEYSDEARAAIRETLAAIREPSANMVRAADEAAFMYPKDYARHHRAMLDHLISELEADDGS